MKYYIAQSPSNNNNQPNVLETSVGAITFILGLISIVTMLWKIASFMQVLGISIDLLKKDVQELEVILKRLHRRYENIHFFLIRQHGVEVVSKNLREDDREDGFE